VYRARESEWDDTLIERAGAEGGDTVASLAAGLDARPYLMSLKRSLR
jgi:hypothetical protein